MKLTLRDLFWLVLVAAMAVGWWVDHRRLAADAVDLEKAQWKALLKSLDREDLPDL